MPKRTRKLIWGILILLIAVIVDNRKKPPEQIPERPTIPTVTPTQIPTQIEAVPTATAGAQVVEVVDGDTLKVLVEGKKETVRIIGIDTPETVAPRQAVQCFGLEAAAKMKELVLGQGVRLEADATQDSRDRYGRLLRYVFLPDGEDAGLLMIREGYAYEYTYALPYRYQQSYKATAKEARENKLGLWGEACKEVKN